MIVEILMVRKPDRGESVVNGREILSWGLGREKLRTLKWKVQRHKLALHIIFSACWEQGTAEGKHSLHSSVVLDTWIDTHYMFIHSVNGLVEEFPYWWVGPWKPNRLIASLLLRVRVGITQQDHHGGHGGGIWWGVSSWRCCMRTTPLKKMKTDIRNHWHYGHDGVEGRYREVGKDTGEAKSTAKGQE